MLWIASVCLAATGCAVSTYEPRDVGAIEALRHATDVEVAFVDIGDLDPMRPGEETGSMTTLGQSGSASVIGPNAILVTPHQIPEGAQYVGARGLVLMGRDVLSLYTVREIVQGELAVSGWALLETAETLANHGPAEVEGTLAVEAGTRVYIVGYPHEPGERRGRVETRSTIINGLRWEVKAESIGGTRRIVPATVVGARGIRSNQRGDEFLFAEVSIDGSLFGASGGGVYVVDSEQRLRRVGIFAGSTPRRGRSPIIASIVRPGLGPETWVEAALAR